MKKDTEVELKCTKEYVGEEHTDGAIVALTLQDSGQGVSPRSSGPGTCRACVGLHMHSKDAPQRSQP